MKKALCIIVALIILTATVVACAACSPDKMKEATKNADKYTIAASYDAETHVLTANQTVEMTNRSSNAFEAVKFHIFA